MAKFVKQETPWDFGVYRYMFAERGKHAGELPSVVIENGYVVTESDDDAEPQPIQAGKYLMVVAANLGVSVTALGVANVISGWVAFLAIIPCVATFCVLKGFA